MNEQAKRSWNTLIYTVLFCFSFVFFVYLTFPYGVLKEALTAQIGKAAGISIRIEEFGPSLPLGFKAKKVRISEGSGGPTLQFDRIDVSISVLRLMVGRLGLSADITVPGGGRLSATAVFSMLKFFDQTFIPKTIHLQANKFGIADLVAFMTSHLAQSPGTNPMVAPMLTKIGMKGTLNGEVNFDLDTGNLPQSTGDVNLTFADAALMVDDPSLNLAEQKFDKAAIKAAIKGGVFDLSDTSGFHTQGLILDMAGTVKLRPEMGKSLLDININLKLDNELKQQFGFILDMAGGVGGAVKLQVKGTLDQPSMATI